MPPKKRPPIIMDVLAKPKPAQLKPPKRETQDRLERHISYVNGENVSSSFISIPPSPPRGAHDIERVDDETRLLEIEGLGHLYDGWSTQNPQEPDELPPDSMRKRK
ncbi:hypothetical protein BJ912DRAFT_1067752 [Pholiota molesta]|nr:hypothetical protein BJ912DRAFT_1067752 [Pholiota molesta]